MASYLPAVALLVACSADATPVGHTEPGKPIADPALPEGAQPGTARATSPDRLAVDIYVDHIPVATISANQIAHWPQIDTQLPPDATIDMWGSVTLFTASGDQVELKNPAKTYPGTVPALFFSDNRTVLLGMFDPKTLASHGKPRHQVDAVREIHIQLATKAQRSPAEIAYARACSEPKKGEEHPPVGKGHWVGTAYQFNIDEYWTIDLTIDLSTAKVGDKVGSVIYHGYKCKGDLYRLPDIDGKRRVVEHFWKNDNNMCVESCILEFACSGTSLEYRGLYPDGQYVARATLKRADQKSVIPTSK